jgi:NADH:ubiquinone oxidoreductase subunit 6 (subunit J)
MNAVLLALGLVIVAGAATALALRNIIRSVLLLVVVWFGIAAFYLWAGAEFLAFAQALVYGGAVSMVILFAVLLTRRSHAEIEVSPASAGRVAWALLAGGAVAGVLTAAVLRTHLEVAEGPRPFVPVRSLGILLLGPHAAALLIIGAVLTVALLGAVVLAAGGDRGAGGEDSP